MLRLPRITGLDRINALQPPAGSSVTPTTPIATLFDHSVTSMPKIVDAGNYTMGTIMKFTQAGYIDAVYFFKPATAVQDATRYGGVWTTGGVLQGSGYALQTLEAAGPTWVLVGLAVPVPVQANDSFMIGMTLKNGGYAAQTNFFASDYVNDKITGRASAAVSGNSRFVAGTSLTFPTTASSASNYWADVRFRPGGTIPAVPSGGYPSASSTGTHGALTPSGSVASSANGQVIQNLDITGVVTITHNNVTLSNCRVTMNDNAGIAVNVTGSSVTIVDCEISGSVGSYTGVVLTLGGTMRRNNIHHFENGVVVSSNITFTDNYIHDMTTTGANPHYDCFECNGGTNLNISHNTMINEQAQTSALMLDNLSAGLSNITVNDNLLSGGGFALYCDGQFGGGTVQNATIQITNNKMIPGVNDYFAFNLTSPVTSGNVNFYSRLPFI